MRIKHQTLFQYLALPALAAVFYFVLVFIYRKLGLPSPEAIIAWATKYYENYGYWVVLVGALAEGALFINWYLPGSTVVALGAVFARQSGLNIFLMLFMVILGFYSTALLNYALGRFGWYHAFMKLGLKQPLEKVQLKIKDKGLGILFTTYVHPNFGALAATAVGILRLDFFKFAAYTFIAILLWNSFWTVIFYWFGSALLKHINLVIAAGGILVYFMLLRSFKKQSTAKRLNVP
ncbi:MAG: VTT domain-containing protein [Candidatus Doudnabacteria bacterium]|nr:VTT domain-containing protein [Candidatus Doudnabacteria bacterium]